MMFTDFVTDNIVMSRQVMSKPQKALLDVLAAIVREYEDAFCRLPNKRHSKTTITFEGDRYKITDFQTKWRKAKKQLNKNVQ